MIDLIVIGILVILVGIAVFYILKEKKKGQKCIGCPSSGCCTSKKCGIKNRKSKPSVQGEGNE